MEWFAFGIDPLLSYLDLNLSGIPISSLPLLGPAENGGAYPLPQLTETFKIMAFCDDVKPAICSVQDFLIADMGATLFENAAGTRLHRDPASNKCKFLPLGKWRNTLTQDDIPTPYMRITDTLDMVGVQLCSTWSATRRKNGDLLREKTQKIIGKWRVGKFMPLVLRPFSANAYALSKLWFRCSTINLRESDFSYVNSTLKRWLYADMLLKPEETVLFRSQKEGGLGLLSVKFRSLAYLTRTFLEMAAHPKYLHSQFLHCLYQTHVMDETAPCTQAPPYYNMDFFMNIKDAYNSGHDILNMSVKQWYHFFQKRATERNPNLAVCSVERIHTDANWEEIWAAYSMPCFSAATRSFLFKMLHELLPTEQRLFRIGKHNETLCRYSCLGQPIADLAHCLLSCDLVKDVGTWLLKLDPSKSVADILQLRLENVGNIWLIANVLEYCWYKRSQGKKAELVECTAKLKCDVRFLRSSKFQNIEAQVSEMLSQF